jgi:serine/threonine protein kinase
MTAAVVWPRVVGRYALYGEIAAGGMATVHFGRLLGPVGFTRTVAIKRLYPHFAKDAEFVAMFLDEARLAGRIRHPNVVQTLDVVASEGELFLVMEYVQGEPLSRLRRLATERAEPISPRIATSILCGLLHGLHAAHEATSDRGEPLDIVHRDVSPQNVLVGTDGIARVLDFGVAKAVGRAHATRDGRLKGKLAYMAPEQLEGRATRQTDIFAASIVLWEVLTGERLFDGGDDRAVIGKVLNLAIEPPSRRIAHRTGLPQATRAQLEALDAVTLRGLSRCVEDRFDSARSMAVALENCMGVASPTEVGEWVERTAGDLLRQRSARIADIESDSSSPARLTTPSPEGHPSRGRLLEAPEAFSPAGADPLLHTQVTSPTVSGATTPARPATRRRAAPWVLAAGGAATVLVLFAASRKIPERAPQVAARTTEPVESSPSADPPGASSPSPLAASPPSAATAPVAPTAPMASVSRAVDPAHARGITPRRPPLSHKPDCDPPYTLDSAGHQRFKEQCFR